MLLVTIPQPSQLKGNSGGPVLDRRGEVIGVLVKELDRVLVVPINAAKPMLAASDGPVALGRTSPQISKEQRVERDLSIAQEVVRLNPDLPEAHNWLALCYAFFHRFVDAVVEFEAATRLKPDSTFALVRLAELYLELGQRSRAEEHYATLKRLDPEQARRLSKAFGR